jgi:hypothetical protein
MNTVFNQEDKLFMIRKELMGIYNEDFNGYKIEAKRKYRKKPTSILLRNKKMELIEVYRKFIYKYRDDPDYVETDSDYE